MSGAYLRPLLQQDLVVLTQRRAKYDGGDTLETVDPLLAFGPLTADVEHMYSEQGQ